jgi:ABC-type transport system involved in multi-copper enzyme maturation permease subunit
MRLIRSELLKIRTTNAWWLFTLGALVMLALALLVNMLNSHYLLDNIEEMVKGAPPEQAEQIRAQADVLNIATNLYTSGQFFGLLFVMLLGIILVTNEFHHQTATVTFLTTPHRTAVILAKFVAATIFGVLLWAVTTAVNIPATMAFLAYENLDNHLGESEVTRAILLNLLAYLLWGILGVGFGVLIRSQIGATVTAVVLYLIGTTAASILFTVLAQWLDADWISELQVIVPSIASNLMITGTELPGSPPQWVGAAVLAGWTVVTGAIGTLILRQRDIA